jgi:hypothetical protein
MRGMLSNPERADVVQEQICHAVTALLAQGHKLTKRTVAEAAGCSATTVMKYRALWRATEISGKRQTTHTLPFARACGMLGV